MARFFPTLGSCRFDSPGERRLAQRFSEKLDDDCLCWHNVPVGPKALQPDFVLLQPEHGLLVLEVKDWQIESIQQIDKSQVQLVSGERLSTAVNPQVQARVYALEVVRALQKDPALCQQGNEHAGKLVMPWGHGVVLTAITRQQFDQHDLGRVLNARQVICQDEMTESVDAASLRQRLQDMLVQRFPHHLSAALRDRVRYLLFPELRISQQSAQFGLFSSDEAPPPDLIKVMDLQQEQLARSMGGGHRVIHGAAGSGKTMILAYRCLHLARTGSQPILVLCYNKSLAGRLRQLLAGRGLQQQVEVDNFHAWCSALLQRHQLPLPEQQLPQEQWAQELVERTRAAISDGRIPGGQYAAVLIDEGHDFEPEWFRLAVQMLDPESNALLVLYDDAQAIYQGQGQRRGLDFSFASVGIQAQGRTTILRLNYRNTREVLMVARAFASELLDARDAAEDGVPMIEPQSAGRSGSLPELIQCESDWQEPDLLIQCIREEQARGRPLSDMAVIYREKKHAGRLELAMSEAEIPYTSARSSSQRKQLFGEEDAVKVISMHSSKGLEFGLVLIPGLDDLPNRHGETSDEARLLYVAMTRAVDRLVMTHVRQSAFSQRVAAAIEQVQHQLQQD